MTEEPLDIVPMPPLVNLLAQKEREKLAESGSLLTESEVIEIRDGAPSIALPRSVHLQLVEKRGYKDVAPENVWDEWQSIRRQFEGPR